MFGSFLLVLAGWALSEISGFIRFKRETPIELRKKAWEKSAAFTSMPRAWDYVFSRDQCYWLEIKLKDGTVVIGKYSTKSFTSNYSQEDDIFIEDGWIVGDETFEEHESRGFLIFAREVSYIEIYKIMPAVQENDGGGEKCE